MEGSVPDVSLEEDHGDDDDPEIDEALGIPSSNLYLRLTSIPRLRNATSTKSIMS